MRKKQRSKDEILMDLFNSQVEKLTTDGARMMFLVILTELYEKHGWEADDLNEMVSDGFVMLRAYNTGQLDLIELIEQIRETIGIDLSDLRQTDGQKHFEAVGARSVLMICMTALYDKYDWDELAVNEFAEACYEKLEGCYHDKYDIKAWEQACKDTFGIDLYGEVSVRDDKGSSEGIIDKLGDDDFNKR